MKHPCRASKATTRNIRQAGAPSAWDSRSPLIPAIWRRCRDTSTSAANKDRRDFLRAPGAVTLRLRYFDLFLELLRPLDTVGLSLAKVLQPFSNTYHAGAPHQPGIELRQEIGNGGRQRRKRS